MIELFSINSEGSRHVIKKPIKAQPLNQKIYLPTPLRTLLDGSSDKSTTFIRNSDKQASGTFSNGDTRDNDFTLDEARRNINILDKERNYRTIRRINYVFIQFIL